jgi:hypothetical protein
MTPFMERLRDRLSAFVLIIVASYILGSKVCLGPSE